MNLMELFVKIGVDDQASGKLNTITGKLGNGLRTAANVGIKAATAASGAVVGLTTMAVKSYAEYEQLVGGVDTLFKDSASTVKQYAADAYKTAGMSANDYMRNATAFSASLISSLGGDTAKAAEYANTAMVSMSDNANKMGTDIESIVATYQSLARGNYAMLDNLKLGYGGTKAELQRLIADAATYTDVQKEMGLVVDASSMSFDNIVNAIAVVQGHLGIAGATAEEAATTIEGSVLSMKAAWQNLVVGVADDNANFERLINNFVDSTATAADNLLPRIEVALVGVAKLIEELFPVIMERIPDIITKTLPKIMQSAGNIVLSLIQGIIDAAPALMDTALEIILMLANGLSTALPELIPAIVAITLQIVETLTNPKTLTSLIEVALQIVIAIGEGLIRALPEIGVRVPLIVGEIVTTLLANLPKILAVGVDMLKALWDGIKSWIPTMIRNVADFAKELPKTFGNGLGSLLTKGKEWIKSLWSGINNWASTLKENIIILAKTLPNKISEGIGNLINKGKDWIKSLWSGISGWANTLKNNVVALAKTLPNKIKEGIGSLVEKGREWIKTLWTGISSWAETLRGNVVNLAKILLERFKNNIGSLLNTGTSWINTLWTGISNWANTLKNNITKLAKSLIDRIKNNLSSLKTTGKNWIITLWNGMAEWSGELKTRLATFIRNLPKTVSNAMGSIKTIGGNFIIGFWNGIADKAQWLYDSIRNVCKNALQAIKNFFGIKSPSTVMRDQVGRYVAEGIAVGFMENDPMKEIEKSLNDGLNAVIPSVKIKSGKIGVDGFSGGNSGGVSVVQNIYSKAQTAADLMQEAVYQQERAVWLGV